MVAATVFKPLSMAGGCLTSLSTLPVAKNPHSLLFPRKPTIRSSHISRFSPLLPLRNRSRPTSFLVAKTSDWARQEEESEVGLSDWEGEAPFGAEGEAEGEDGYAEEGQEEGEVVAEGEFEGGEEFAEEVEGAYPEPPEEAKLFVGNLPYDIDSEKLAHMFEDAGVVEVAEVIYNRETDQSRGFGFVTMSTVEDAEKAVDKFHRYDFHGRLLTVNKAAPRGARPERTTREFEPSFRVYVGNLPWQVDDARLEQIFSEYGKVVDARVVYDRETGRSRGFGFVTMSTKVELDNVIAAFDGQNFEGRTIRVNVAEERPRRGSF